MKNKKMIALFLIFISIMTITSFGFADTKSDSEIRYESSLEYLAAMSKEAKMWDEYDSRAYPETRDYYASQQSNEGGFNFVEKVKGVFSEDSIYGFFSAFSDFTKNNKSTLTIIATLMFFASVVVFLYCIVKLAYARGDQERHEAKKKIFASLMVVGAFSVLPKIVSFISSLFLSFRS